MQGVVEACILPWLEPELGVHQLQPAALCSSET